MADGILENLWETAKNVALGDGSSGTQKSLLDKWRGQIIKEHEKAGRTPIVRFNEDKTILLDFTEGAAPRAWVVEKEDGGNTNEIWYVPMKNFKADESSIFGDLEAYRATSPNNYVDGFNDDRELDISASRFNAQVASIRSNYDIAQADYAEATQKITDKNIENYKILSDRFNKLPDEKVKEITEKLNSNPNFSSYVGKFEQSTGITFDAGASDEHKYFVISEFITNGLLYRKTKSELGDELIRDFTPKKPGEPEKEKPLIKPDENGTSQTNTDTDTDNKENPGSSIGSTIMGFAKEHPIISLIAVAVAGIFGLNFLDPSKENAGTLLGKVGHGTEMVGDGVGIAASIAAISMLWKEYGGTISTAISGLMDGVSPTDVLSKATGAGKQPG